MTFDAPVPIFRIFDYDAARKFYVDWLGFAIDWEHTFEQDCPRYLQVSRDGLRLHLTEHFGDCTPGSRIYVVTDDVDALHKELHDRPNKNMRPGICDTPWGTREVEVVDPFGNRITFAQRK